MADLLEDVRTQIRARLDALRPAVDELARLEQALSALEARPQSAPPPSASAPRTSRRQTRRTRGGQTAKAPAEREALRARALELIGERPGITKAELRQTLGLSGQEIGQLVRRLLAAQAIENLALPSGSDGYRTPAPADAQEHDDAPAECPEGDAEPTATPSGEDAEPTVSPAADAVS